MSDGSDSKLRFEPVHEGHAIEQVALTVQFNGALSDAHIVAMDELGSKQVTDLPRKGFVQTVVVAVGPTPPLFPSQSGPGGVVFQKYRPDGTIEAELRLERSAMTFRTLFYTRWAEVWGKAKAYISLFLPFYREAGQFHAIGLNYADKFIWKGTSDRADMASLLRPNSPYLCPHVYRAADLWHSHTGAFVRPDAQTKRLLNVDVDVLDEPRPGGAQRVVSIRTALTDSFNQPGYEALIVGKELDLAIDFCNNHMDNLHDSEKAILAQILSDEMCRRIQLGAGNE